MRQVTKVQLLDLSSMNTINSPRRSNFKSRAQTVLWAALKVPAW